jgi:hypothetical protein
MQTDGVCDAARMYDDEAERLLDAASALDDSAEALLAQSSDLENQALAEVGRFEAQRDVVNEALARLHAAELCGDPSDAVRGRFLVCEHEKKRLWTNVERLWAESKRCLLRSTDHRARAERLRAEAARLWAVAGELRAALPAMKKTA